MWLDLFECLGMPLKVDPARFLCILPVLRGPSKKKKPLQHIVCGIKKNFYVDRTWWNRSLVYWLQKFPENLGDGSSTTKLPLYRQAFIHRRMIKHHSSVFSFIFIHHHILHKHPAYGTNEWVYCDGWVEAGGEGKIWRDSERWEAEAVNRGRQELRVYQGMFW